MRAGFEGGQMPIYMRLAKQRGNTSKDAMPSARTAPRPRASTCGSSSASSTRHGRDAGALAEKGLVKNTRVDIKILGDGELTKALTVTAHRFSKAAREKIEAAGGTATALREPVEQEAKRRKRASTPAR